MNIRINKKQRLDYVVNKDPLREALRNVLFTSVRRGDKYVPTLVATDGTVMAVVPLGEGEVGKDMLIGKDVFKEARKVKGRGVQLELSDDQGCSILDAGNPVWTVYPTTLEADRYPDWEGAWYSQHRADGRIVGLDSKKLYDLSRALGSERVILIIPEEPEDQRGVKNAITVLPYSPEGDSEIDRARGMIMPVRVGPGRGQLLLEQYQEEERRTHEDTDTEQESESSISD